jgi:hypothetical protein
MVLDIAASLGIPIPKSVYVHNDNDALSSMEKNGIESPAFVKPNSTDGVPHETLLLLEGRIQQ